MAAFAGLRAGGRSAMILASSQPEDVQAARVMEAVGLPI